MTADGAPAAVTPKPKEKGPACKLSTIINGQFVTVQLIGKGGYGVVYEVIRLNSPNTRYACKAELALAHNNLKTEWDLMTLLKDNKSKHNIIGVELGSERNFNYIIMHLVGPSLADLRKNMPNKTFSLYTTAVCGIQCYDSLVEIQKLGYIHRDVKPSNFAIGVLGTEEEKLVHVLDFGLCRNMFNKNKELRKPRMKAPFRGTIPYCSLNIHQRMEPGRHDDFWSLLYMMIEFHLSDLPWENMNKENTKKEKETKIDSLLARCPPEFQMIRCYLLTLTYSREPDYVKLRGVLCQVMTSKKFTSDMPLDWQIGGPHESIFKPMANALKHKGSKRKVNLSELLDLPKPGSKVYIDGDFPHPGEQEPPRDESVSKSDDTIIEKEGPPPAPKPVRPIAPPLTSLPPNTRTSGEQHHKPGTTISVKPIAPRSTGEHNSLKPVPVTPGARSPTGHHQKANTLAPRGPVDRQSVRRVAIAPRPKSDNEHDSVKPVTIHKHANTTTTMTSKLPVSAHPIPVTGGSMAAPAYAVPPPK